MTTLTLAARVKKARTTGGVCPLCNTVIIAGQQIGKVSESAPDAAYAGRWSHTACLIRRQPMIGPHSGA